MKVKSYVVVTGVSSTHFHCPSVSLSVNPIHTSLPLPTTLVTKSWTENQLVTDWLYYNLYNKCLDAQNTADVKDNKTAA